jgi:hypothetical protein
MLAIMKPAGSLFRPFCFLITGVESSPSRRIGWFGKGVHGGLHYEK